MALMRDDDYLDGPASVAAEAIQLYVYSLERLVYFIFIITSTFSNFISELWYDLKYNISWFMKP